MCLTRGRRRRDTPTATKDSFGLPVLIVVPVRSRGRCPSVSPTRSFVHLFHFLKRMVSGHQSRPCRLFYFSLGLSFTSISDLLPLPRRPALVLTSFTSYYMESPRLVSDHSTLRLPLQETFQEFGPRVRVGLRTTSRDTSSSSPADTITSGGV